MIKLASDENFDGDVVRGLMRRVPELDIVHGVAMSNRGYRNSFARRRDD